MIFGTSRKVSDNAGVRRLSQTPVTVILDKVWIEEGKGEVRAERWCLIQDGSFILRPLRPSNPADKNQ